MDKNELFWELVKHHYEHNWIQLQGKNHGTLIIANKSHTIDELAHDGIITNDASISIEAKTSEQVQRYLRENGQLDRAHIYVNNEFTNIGMANNYVPEINRMGRKFYELMPEDFYSYNMDTPIEKGSGTRRKTALIIPYVHSELETLIITKSHYGDYPIGKVVHVNNTGVIEEFFLLRSSEAPQLDSSRNMIGVYRELPDCDKSQFNEYLVYRTGSIENGYQYMIKPRKMRIFNFKESLMPMMT